MKWSLVFIFCLFSCSINGQDVNFEWATEVGGTSNDFTQAVATDGAGNVYTTGTFAGTADMDPSGAIYNMTAQGTFDIFITKYDASGNFIWTRQIGNSNPLNEGLRGLTVDIAGNIYITGFFSGTLDFDPGTGIFNLTCTGSGYAAYLLHLDNNGNFGWARNIAQSDYGNIGYSVTTSASGNIYVLGTFKGLTDFDPGPGVYNINSPNSAQDIFISKFDNSGNFLWSRQFFATMGQVGYSIKVDALENIYTTGIFYGTSDFDPGPAVYNLVADNQILGSWSDAFISKLDANGNFMWAKHITGTYDDISRSLALDQLGNLYVTGEFSGQTDFDPGPGTFIMTDPGDTRSFVLKLTTNGGFVWAKDFRNVAGSTSQGWEIACDGLGDVYTVGSFIHSIDFDPGNADYIIITPSNWANMYISKLKADGSFAFAKHIGTDQLAIGFSITVDAAKNIYTTGYFAAAPDFDPEVGVHILHSNGPTDGFVLKLSQCVQRTSQTISASGCISYTLNNQTYTASGVYTQHLTNVAGCDSTITLQLTIGGSVNVATVTACDSYVWEGQTYTASGNYSVTYIGTDGCDSIRKLDLVIRNSITSSVNVSLCEGQSYLGYTVSGSYTDVFVAVNGCDSIRTLHLIVKARSQEVFNVTTCEGDIYWGHTTSGTYRDTLVAANGCDSIRILTLVVNPVKRLTNNVAICKGESYFAGGADQTASGVYSDTLTTNLGCDSIITTVLAVHQLPIPDLGSDKDLCAGSTLQLMPGLFASYVWQDQSTEPVFNAAGTGIYWVKVTGTNQCVAIDSIEIKNILPVPADFLKEADSICQYEKLQLIPTENYHSYSWSTGSHQSSILVDGPGQYFLEVRDNNGCYGNDTTNIYSKICGMGVFIPTAFTPNGDQRNDIFRAIIYGNLVSFKMQVYNRWGELVFMSSDPYRGWDGRVNGIDTDTGAFAWLCQYQLRGSKVVTEKGTVTLIR